MPADEPFSNLAIKNIQNLFGLSHVSKSTILHNMEAWNRLMANELKFEKVIPG
jgi:hypothetical protein